MNLFEHIKKPVQYWQDGQTILDADGKMIADIRGWGWIQNHVKDSPELFQDKMGQVIADAINNIDAPTALSLKPLNGIDWDKVEAESDPYVVCMQELKDLSIRWGNEFDNAEEGSIEEAGLKGRYYAVMQIMEGFCTPLKLFVDENLSPVADKQAGEQFSWLQDEIAWCTKMRDELCNEKSMMWYMCDNRIKKLMSITTPALLPLEEISDEHAEQVARIITGRDSNVNVGFYDGRMIVGCYDDGDVVINHDGTISSQLRLGGNAPIKPMTALKAYDYLRQFYLIPNQFNNQ